MDRDFSTGRLKDGRTRAAGWALMYTGMFLFGLLAFVLILLWHDRTLVWTPDGIDQHYTVIGYVGQAVRDLLSGKGYRMINFSLGQGLDVLTTCTYYGYTDPLSLLAAFAGREGIEAVYMITDFLRLYLAGLFLGLYVRKVGVQDHWSTACAAIIYVFDGYALYLVGRHPYFLNGALYLPLLLLGVERILENRRWLMFTLITALMLVVNFYFAYMNTLAAVIYIVVRLIARLRTQGVRESAKDGFTLLGAYLLGTAFSAIVFLPVVRLYFSNSRLGVRAGYRGSMLTYGLSYGIQQLLNMFVPGISPGNFANLNYLPLALFGLLPLFFMRDSRARQVRIGLYLCALAMMTPAVCLIFNGMAYVSSRWIYIFGLFVALGCALGLPEIFRPDWRWRKLVSLIAVIYGVGLLARVVRGKMWQLLPAPLFIMGFALLLLLFDRAKVRLLWLNPARARTITAVLLTGICMVYIAVVYMPMGYNYISAQEKSGIYPRIASASAGHLIDDGGVYRVSGGVDNDAHAMILDYMGTSFYWSLIDARMSEYYLDLGLPTQTSAYRIDGFGGNAVMNAVAGVKYYVRNDGENYVMPYGYERTDTLSLPDGRTAELFENQYALPLGYAYDRTMSEEEYGQLPVEDKLQALTRYAVCGREGLQETDFDSAAIEVDYDIAGLSEVEMQDGALKGKKGGYLDLRFEAREDCETYLIFEGLKIHVPGRKTNGRIQVWTENGVAQSLILPVTNNFYFPKEIFAFCLGDSAALNGCRIEFANAQDYDYDAFRVVHIPRAGYRADMEARRAEAMQDVTLSNNRIEGNITVASDRVLQIAVPYSEGWSAWVDGEEREIYPCGGMYMGVDLTAGAHRIELRYVTPGLPQGAAISLGALVLIIALLTVGKFRKKSV